MTGVFNARQNLLTGCVTHKRLTMYPYFIDNKNDYHY